MVIHFYNHNYSNYNKKTNNNKFLNFNNCNVDYNNDHFTNPLSLPLHCLHLRLHLHLRRVIFQLKVELLQ